MARGVSFRGKVVVELLVHRDGHVESFTVLDGDELWTRAVCDAVPGWRFKENFGLRSTPEYEYARTIITFRISNTQGWTWTN